MSKRILRNILTSGSRFLNPISFMNLGTFGQRSRQKECFKRLSVNVAVISIAEHKDEN